MKKSPDNILIGMGGWELPSFNDLFYPQKPPRGFRKLGYYSRFFDLVEVNATFYNTSFPPSQAHRWLKDVENNKDFVFTIKLYRGFTHTFDATKNDAIAVHRLLDPIREKEKLGGLVMQFSSSFNKADKRLDYLAKLRSIFPEDNLFLDIRHKSWDSESFYKFCADNGFHLINVDLPRLASHMPFNTMAWKGTAYFRMMGRNAEAWNGPRFNERYLYEYNEEELKDLLRRIKQTGADRTYVVFHNDVQAFSLVNGRQLGHALNPAKRFFSPASLIATFPQLKSFCDPLTPDAGGLDSRQNMLPLT